MYNADEDGDVFSEKEIVRVLASHYAFYNNMPWFIKLFYRSWPSLLDSLVSYLAPTYIARIGDSMSVLDEVDHILEESSDENSDS